jgi:uncharacterized protein YeeX (DUF496 family)
MLTFQSGHIILIKNIFEIELANEILQILKLEWENRVKSYFIKNDENKEEINMYLLYENKYDAVHSI